MTEPWKNLANGRGTNLAVYEGFAAAAELSRMTVWSAGETLAVIESKTQIPARPQFIKDRLYWGDFILDLDTGTYDQIDGVAAALKVGTGLPTVPSPLGDYIPVAITWSTNRDYIVVSANWVGTREPRPARVVLLDKKGRFSRVLSQQNEAAPTAVWAGSHAIVVGGRRVEIFSFDGAQIGGFNLTTPAVRIESTLDERKLLLVEHGQLTVIDPTTRSIIGSKRGRFLDASMDPSGQFVMALDLTGKMNLIPIDAYLITQRTLQYPDSIQGLSLGSEQVIASFSSGNPIRTAFLKSLWQ